MPKSASKKAEPLGHDPLEVALALYFAREEECDESSNCLSEVTIRAFLARELDNRRQQHAISHLAECSRCSTHLIRLIESPGQTMAAKLHKFGVSVQEMRRKTSKALPSSKGKARKDAATGAPGPETNLKGESRGFEWSLAGDVPGKHRLRIRANEKWLHAQQIGGGGSLVAMLAKWEEGKARVQMVLIGLRILGKRGMGETVVGAGATLLKNSEGEFAFIMPPAELPAEMGPAIRESRLANLAIDPAASALWDSYFAGLSPETLRAVSSLDVLDRENA